MFDFEDIEKRELTFENSSVSKSEQQLIANIEFFHKASFIRVGADGEISYINSRAQDLFEIPTEHFHTLGRFVDFMSYLAQRGDFNHIDPEGFMNAIRQSVNGDKTALDSFEVLTPTTPSGKILRLRFAHNTDGSITLACHNISSEKSKENILEMALDIGLAGYIYINSAGQTSKVESRYLSHLLTDDEFKKIQDTGWNAITHPDDIEAGNAMIKSVLETGQTQSKTLRIVTQQAGVRSFRLSLMPETRDIQNASIIAFFSDITGSIRQQEYLSKAKQVAENSLRSKEDFLARMSHEIRTPMNAVIGMTDALIHHNADETIKPQLELIQKSATSTLKLLDETLTYSRIESDNFELNPNSDSPAEVIQDVCALWEQQALKNGVKITVTIKPSVPDTIVFDKFRYEQCVNNLLSNAVKFTNNGKIDVVLTTIEKAGHAPSLVLAVRDTGIGMTAEQQARIFEAYTQADKSISSRFGGTGLGMNITKQIVERMGGSISVRSVHGSGSLFAMSIPIQSQSLDTQHHDSEAETKAEAVETVVETSVVQAAATPALQSQGESTTPILNNVQQDLASPVITAEIETKIEVETASETQAKTEITPQLSQASTPEAIAGRETAVQNNTSQGLVAQMLEESITQASVYAHLNILVVDDNTTNHLVIKSLIQSLVGSITVASNGVEALKILDSTPIDLVLMDIHMPVMDGIECTIAIRGSEKPWKDVLIIALTADPQYQQKKLCLNIGMNEALGKPVRLNDLLEAFENVLDDPDSDDMLTHESRNEAAA